MNLFIQNLKTMKKLAKQYDPFAEKYTGLYVGENHKSTEVFFDCIKKYFPKINKPHLLDIGCGAGTDFDFYQSHNFICAGVDASSVMCLLANKSGSKVDIRNEDFSQLRSVINHSIL